jgi:glyoxylase-like metal-dependent hydrolase (beta-lactamase superfamily II)
MKTLLRSSILLVAWVGFFACGVASAFQVGTTDYTKGETKVTKLRNNLNLIQIKTPQDLNNILVLSGPEGYLLVDHPEPAARALVQAQLDALGKQPVRYLLNTHWHYDHVGGNEIYGSDATIVAYENVRTRMMVAQKPFWSPAAIGPYPANAWPRITFRDSLTIHFDGDDIEMDHYANGHTDTDSVVYFARANAVDVGDIYNGRGEDLAAGLDMVGIATSLTAVLGHINDETIIVTGHSKPSNRRDLAEYLQILNATIDGVRRDIAAGKTEKEIADAGLPAIWAPWFAPLKFSGGHDFMRAIYGSLQHTNPMDQ